MFFLAVAPVGMWKSGGGWASRWAGVFLPVHRFVHALEPRSGTASSCRISTYPRAATQGGRDAAGMGRRRDAGSFWARQAENAAALGRRGRAWGGGRCPIEAMKLCHITQL